MRGNFIWARAANSGPNKLWISLCWVWLHKNSGSFICWKTPHKTHRCLLHPYGREPEKHEMSQKRLGPSSWQDVSISQQYTRCFPAPQLMSTAKHVWAPSPAAGRKVKSMSTPGGIKFDPDCNLFHEACRNLSASQLWTLDEASTWSAYSGKHSRAQQNIFSWSSLTMDLMDQRLRHLFGSDDSWKWRDCSGLFSTKCNLKLLVFYFFWGLAPFAFSLSSPENSSAYPTLQLSSSQSLPGGTLVGAAVTVLNEAELWASCPSAASPSTALPVRAPA